MAVIIPPIKSQGIKTKLVPWINDLILTSGISLNARWIEPFFGTGVVGFNSPVNGTHIVGDTNPHIINFYQQIQSGEITPYTMRAYLERESKILETAEENGYTYYRLVRNRFNEEHSPYDFIFLSRAGFNGMMRFNRHGDWNIPFCKKPERFAPAYITKICNQVAGVAQVIKKKEWSFNNDSFLDTIAQAGENDIIYCDPPYYGRYVDYYNGWTEKDEEELFYALSKTRAKFILSTWHHNDYRPNEMIKHFWGRFNVTTKEHFYHNGGKIENRHSMVEALVFNFDLQEKVEVITPHKQLELFTTM
ncbi:DNA adenine methylase [Prevotella bivia DNF00188]|uniref:DNA adenine methylase n=1 Tax=Prevotella bivia TaxID=28125 RepID=UPI00050E3580|nr:Dam family site-specific DNA-(adenine-N6)-methyltransferase [Prevotella bivia]KGF22314.1 DNA adenine methylase [Prevotella bivia DNF00188]